MTRRQNPETQIHRAVVQHLRARGVTGIWHPVPGWKHYEVSSCGQVCGPRGPMKLFLSRKGYLTLQLSENYRFKTIGVARLVAAAFLPDFDPSLQVDHIDGNKTNNNVANLRMVNNSQNAKNRGLYKTNSLGVKGVTFRRRSRNYVARIQVNRKRIELGEFPTCAEASVAYEAAAALHFGEFNRGSSHAAT